PGWCRVPATTRCASGTRFPRSGAPAGRTEPAAGSGGEQVRHEPARVPGDGAAVLAEAQVAGAYIHQTRPRCWGRWERLGEKRGQGRQIKVVTDVWNWT